MKISFSPEFLICNWTTEIDNWTVIAYLLYCKKYLLEARTVGCSEKQKQRGNRHALFERKKIVKLYENIIYSCAFTMVLPEKLLKKKMEKREKQRLKVLKQREEQERKAREEEMAKAKQKGIFFSISLSDPNIS